MQSALLQSSSAGNAGCTLIQKPLAQILGLVDALGRPTQSYSRSIKVQGVVAGASETIQTVTLTYQLKGEYCMLNSCGVHRLYTPADACAQAAFEGMWCDAHSAYSVD